MVIDRFAIWFVALMHAVFVMWCGCRVSEPARLSPHATTPLFIFIPASFRVSLRLRFM